MHVVSGGQSGVDRAALDAALACGMPAGGWCPAGRWAEDGPIDPRYPLQETPLSDTAQRTSWNVRDSDGTLVLADGLVAGGTAFAVAEAVRLEKPLLCLALGEGHPERVLEWMEAGRITRLNVAGPRESEAPGIYVRARAFLEPLFRTLVTGAPARG